MAVRRPIALLLAMFLFSLALAGCTEKPGVSGGLAPTSEEPTPDETGIVTATDQPAPTASDKPVQTGSQVKVDPNGTFVGGAHTHDWWAGETQAVILDKTYNGGPGNMCIGAATFGCNGGVQFIYLESSPDPHERPNNVWPGTGKMTIRVVTAAVYQPFMFEVAGPGGYAWAKTRYAVTKADQTITLENLGENNTDPPHFRGSGWTFRVWSSSPVSVFQGPIKVEITIYKARDPPLDPPHPDLWQGLTQRVLAQQRTYANWTRVANQNRGDGYANDGYGQGPQHGTPLKYPMPENSTVTIATGKIRVVMKWTNTETALANKPGLRYCTADQDCRLTAAIWQFPRPTTDGANERVYELEVRPDQWDSPYVHKTRWAFSWYFDDAQGLNVGNFKGTVDWTIEIFKVE